MKKNSNLVSKFVVEMSERQISTREFFSVVLLEALDRYFGLDKTAMLIFDTNGNFNSWIKKNGLEVSSPEHPYLKVMKYDKMRKAIYEDAVRDHLTYFNQEPRIYRGTDYYSRGKYESSRFADCIEKEFQAHYALSLAFGINAYIQILFFKSQEEGDYSEEEMEEFEDIYRYIAMAYAGFKKHEQTKIISNIQDEIIESGEQAYLVTDDFTRVMAYNTKALDHLKSILGEAIVGQVEGNEPCLWLPFLLEGAVEAGKVLTKEIRNCIFKIYTYDQSYSHGIIDRYHWITILIKEEAGDGWRETVHLTAAEKRVVELICEGYTYRKIADKLCVSYHTVKNHVQNIFAKYEISSRHELYKVHKQ